MDIRRIVFEDFILFCTAIIAVKCFNQAVSVRCKSNLEEWVMSDLINEMVDIERNYHKVSKEIEDQLKEIGLIQIMLKSIDIYNGSGIGDMYTSKGDFIFYFFSETLHLIKNENGYINLVDYRDEYKNIFIENKEFGIDNNLISLFVKCFNYNNLSYQSRDFYNKNKAMYENVLNNFKDFINKYSNGEEVDIETLHYKEKILEKISCDLRREADYYINLISNEFIRENLEV